MSEEVVKRHLGEDALRAEEEGKSTRNHREPKQQEIEKNGEIVKEALSVIPEARSGELYSYKVGGNLIRQLVSITNEILSHRRNLEEAKAEALKLGKKLEPLKERGEYYSVPKRKGEAPIVKQVGKKEIYAIVLAEAKRLDRDSYKAGKENEKAHSGMLLRDTKKAMEAKTWTDFWANSPIIDIPLKELCEFSTYSTEGKEAIDAAINLINNAPLKHLEWKFAYLLQRYKEPLEGGSKGGNEEENLRRNLRRPIHYVLLLNPIFADLASNFGVLAQEAGKRLNEVAGKEKVAEDILLIALLGAHKSTEPFRRDLPTLVEELDIKEDYESHRGRTEERLYKLFQHRREEGIVEKFYFLGRPRSKRGEPPVLRPPFSAGNRPEKVVAYKSETYAKAPTKEALEESEATEVKEAHLEEGNLFVESTGNENIPEGEK